MQSNDPNPSVDHPNNTLANKAPAIINDNLANAAQPTSAREPPLSTTDTLAIETDLPQNNEQNLPNQPTQSTPLAQTAQSNQTPLAISRRTIIPTIAPPITTPTSQMRTSSDSQTSTPRTQRTTETNTDYMDELSDDQYISRETLQQRLQNLFDNLDIIQAQLLQQSIPSYQQRVNAKTSRF